MPSLAPSPARHPLASLPHHLPLRPRRSFPAATCLCPWLLLVATARDACAKWQRFGASGYPHSSLLGTVPWGHRCPLCPHRLPPATISPREGLHRAVPPLGTSWRYPGASPLLRGPFFWALHSSIGVFNALPFGEGRVGAAAGPSPAARAGARPPVRWRISGRGSCCHGDAKLHPVAAATKVKKLMLRQENHMTRFFFV